MLLPQRPDAQWRTLPSTSWAPWRCRSLSSSAPTRSITVSPTTAAPAPSLPTATTWPKSRAACPIATILVVDGDSGGNPLFWPTLERARDAFTPADTASDDPALIIYASAPTGRPKGALHAHRVLLGHLPGVQLPHDFFPQPSDLYWTPADWAWIGGLLDVLLPSLYFGVPVLAHRARNSTPRQPLR